jgi:hypothetical protein
MIIASLKGKIFKKLHNLVYDDGEMVNAKIPGCRINMTENDFFNFVRSLECSYNISIIVSRLKQKSYGILNSNLANRHIVRLRHGQK